MAKKMKTRPTFKVRRLEEFQRGEFVFVEKEKDSLDKFRARMALYKANAKSPEVQNVKPIRRRA